MEERTCDACGNSFTSSRSKRFCPPTDKDRSRQKKPRSVCSRRWEQYRIRNGIDPPLHHWRDIGKPYDCAYCGVRCIPGENVGTHANKFCSKGCKSRWHKTDPDGCEYRPKAGPRCLLSARPATRTWIAGTCPECGTYFISHDRTKFCSRRCLLRSCRRRRRRLERGYGYGKARLGLHMIAVRDSFKCGLCGEPVDMTLAVPDRHAPTLDHIIPLSRGGEHTPDNVQLAHFICNSGKGNGITGTAARAGAQLLLV